MSPLFTYKPIGYRADPFGSTIAHVTTDTGVSLTVTTPVRRYTIPRVVAGLAVVVLAYAAPAAILKWAGVFDNVIIRGVLWAAGLWFGIWLLRRWRATRHQVTRLDLDATSLRVTVADRRSVAADATPRDGLVVVRPEEDHSFLRALVREDDDPYTALRCQYADRQTRLLLTRLRSDDADAVCTILNTALSSPPPP